MVHFAFVSWTNACQEQFCNNYSKTSAAAFVWLIRNYLTTAWRCIAHLPFPCVLLKLPSALSVAAYLVPAGYLTSVGIAIASGVTCMHSHAVGFQQNPTVASLLNCHWERCPQKGMGVLPITEGFWTAMDTEHTTTT